MDSVEDQFHHIRTEWKVLKEKWFHGETVDPVFEGMVKDFCTFDGTMQDIYGKVEKFMKGVDQLAEGLLTLSESVTSGLARIDDSLIVSDSCKLKEATNQITRADAPHSAIAKLRRDMDFNIMNPIRNHLVNNRNLKAHLEKRRRRLTELNSAKKGHDDCVKKGYATTDRRFLQAKSNLESAKMAFHEVDKHVFEWLYILEEYRGDILDSTLQTLKYLQYEFFATSAHAVSSVLPSRMEFRPMVEMTPEHLEAQVEAELQEAEEGEEEVVTDFSVRLIEKLAKDNKNKPKKDKPHFDMLIQRWNQCENLRKLMTERKEQCTNFFHNVVYAMPTKFDPKNKRQVNRKTYCSAIVNVANPNQPCPKKCRRKDKKMQKVPSQMYQG